LGSGIGEVPDLHLRNAAQVDAGVGTRRELEVEEQLEIAVIALGRGVLALTIVEEHTVLGAPVRLAVLQLRETRRPLGDERGALGVGQRQQLAVIVGAATTPAGEVLAVEQRREARGRLGGAGGKAQRQTGNDEKQTTAESDHDRIGGEGRSGVGTERRCAIH
jgi:hypothetical protein